ncbi:Uncaracterized surface protein containing fasciclin (FAS1) repeats [Limimonas halophila]|uniref:Uncaracterized surface protein containing fasciclin (FAS1) repeats n=1 Tax=Limimonas halophila TaxID=1082479 RepID=A0A1G7LN33_9PROT|nr:fasciclin domain-containing protein [Limimonas halophila]SDF50774.1 Uncaracterized surface protein containing fasciclin (FAS1) repeats [Limimonas halophila]
MLRTFLMATVVTTGLTSAAVAGQMKDLVDTAAGDTRFSTLVEAVQAAGLVETLKGEGPYTVFAPTNAAFDEIPEDRLNSLLKPENRDALRDVLTYHVVAGNVMSGDIAGTEQNVDTVQGTALRVDATGDGVRINDARVVQADIEASNGVIHAIDAVVMPRAQLGERPPKEAEEGGPSD